MPGKTSATATYLKLWRTPHQPRPMLSSRDDDDADAPPAPARTDNGQMTASCGGGQMTAGFADDPALVHF